MGTKLHYSDGNYCVLFDHNGDEIQYILEYQNNKVLREEFKQANRVLLSRGEGGIGKIYAEKEERYIDFQTPQDEIAVVARRDSLQHSYLEPLYQWANRLLFYHFGLSLGKDNLMVVSGSYLILPALDLRDENAVLGIYHHGFSQYGDPFDQLIREDMQAIGYDLEYIGAYELNNIKLTMSGMGGRPTGIAVKEKDLPGPTEHTDISTGMFRALSLFIQLNYAFLSNYPSCILVDDIGEGLDYERSCATIERIISKAKTAGVQLIMSTNDRFVMNNVPLEMWSILQRAGGHIKVFNYENSKKIFDDFKFSGLNNFDFFAYDYLNAATTEEE